MESYVHNAQSFSENLANFARRSISNALMKCVRIVTPFAVIPSGYFAGRLYDCVVISIAWINV
jgi:hypothetical protein